MNDIEQDQRMLDFFSGFKDLVFAGILWLLASLPLFTLGISTSAFYHVVMKSVRKKEGGVLKEFFGFFSKNFVRVFASSLTFVSVAVLVILGLAISLENRDRSQIWNVFSYAYRIMIWFLVMFGIFVFPSFTHSEEKGFAVLCKGVALGIKHLFTSFTLAILIIIAVCVVWYMPVLILVVPGLTTLIISMVLETYLNEELGVVYCDGGKKK
jgi:uncharacterized membrane protein YesL